MTKPENPYRKGTILWNLMEGDWADLTAGQIAETLDTTRASIRSALYRIKMDTGYIVPHRAIKQADKKRR